MDDDKNSNVMGMAMREMTKGEILARRCVQPLREFSDAGGWIYPHEITAAEQMLAGYLDNLRSNR